MLIIETGAIVPNADSYVTEVEADAYHSDRENTAWDTTELDKSALLRKACQYLDNHYLGRWKGTLVQPLTQALQWPRYNVNLVAERNDRNDYGSILSPTIIPLKLKYAQCELALRAINGDLAADLERGGKVSSISVGPITQSFESGASGSTSYPLIDKLLSQFISGSGSQLVRG